MISPSKDYPWRGKEAISHDRQMTPLKSWREVTSTLRRLEKRLAAHESLLTKRLVGPERDGLVTQITTSRREIRQLMSDILWRAID